MATVVEILTAAKDEETNALGIVDIAHKKSHEGKRWYVVYSVADLGAMTTPNDTITLTFKTPKLKDEEDHFTFWAKGTAGWRVRLIEAFTGGGESPTGTLAILNHNRYVDNPSKVTDGITANQVSYDATLATGGTTIWDEYLEGSGGPLAGGTATAGRNELELAPETLYQLSLFGTDNNPGTIGIDYYDARK